MDDVRESRENVENIVANIDEVTSAVDQVPELVREVDDLIRRVKHVERDVHQLTDDVERVTEEMQLRVEIRLEVAMMAAFAALGVERYLAGTMVSGYVFLGLSGLFFLAFLETLAKRKRDLGYVIGRLFG